MSNGSARQPGRPGRSGRLGLPARARGQRDRAGPDAGLAPALETPTRAPCWRRAACRWGCPEGQMGNSEVGHLNLGAGRVVPQDLVRISQSIQSGEFYQLPPLVELCTTLRQSGGTLHLVGLLGPGGVHALDRHLLACVELGVRHRVPAIAIHGFLDGRDSAPTLGAEVVRTLLQDMRRIAGEPGGRRLAHRPLLRHGPRPPLGPHQAGLRRHGPRRRHAGGAPGAGGAGRVPAGRDRRVHPAAGARAERRPGGHDARRRRGAVLQLSQRPDAADRGARSRSKISTSSTWATGRGSPASR